MKRILLLLCCILFFLCSCNTNELIVSEISSTESTPEPSQEPSLITVDYDDMRSDAKVSSDLFQTSIGDGLSYYRIDENGTLWGKGDNTYGQLGIGEISEEVYQTPQKIADDVIHVDYSQHHFAIYLTSDGCLYGMGNDFSGVLLENPDYWDKLDISVTTPKLLMENVQYAACGRDDIVALTSDNTLWTWGVIWDCGDGSFYQKNPTPILDNVKIVTGGYFNHAAIKNDGTLWTWGYNYTWNCGTDKCLFFEEPEMVAENVEMVWTGLLTFSIPDYIDGQHIPRPYENTIIKTTTGELMGCGKNIGTTSKVLEHYYDSHDYDVICSSAFQPIEIVK